MRRAPAVSARVSGNSGQQTEVDPMLPVNRHGNFGQQREVTGRAGFP